MGTTLWMSPWPSLSYALASMFNLHFTSCMPVIPLPPHHSIPSPSLFSLPITPSPPHHSIPSLSPYPYHHSFPSPSLHLLPITPLPPYLPITIPSPSLHRLPNLPSFLRCAVSGLHWLSTHLFAVVYTTSAPPSPDDLPPAPSLMLLTATESSYTFTNFQDVYYGTGNNQDKFFFTYISNWYERLHECDNVLVKLEAE